MGVEWRILMGTGVINIDTGGDMTYFLKCGEGR